jgi:PAP_fibrillin
LEQIEKGDSVSKQLSNLSACLSVQAPNLLNGEWKLVYTSNSELIALLVLSRLPFVTVGDITQTIDGFSLTVTNKVLPLGNHWHGGETGDGGADRSTAAGG